MILRSPKAASISRSTEPLASSSESQTRGGKSRPAFWRNIIKQQEIQVQLLRPSTKSVVRVDVSQEIKEAVNALMRCLEAMAIEKPKLEEQGEFEQVEALNSVHKQIINDITQRLYEFALPLEGNGWVASGIIFPDIAQ